MIAANSIGIAVWCATIIHNTGMDETKRVTRRWFHRPQSKPPEPHWHRSAVGGMWDQIGQLQFDFLVGQGLKPTDTLLDVGCGSLRGGVNFARFLEVGHYYGIDRSAALLDAGKEELRSRRLLDRRPTLVAMDDFGFDRLGVTFDYAIAISVFTHLPLNDIWLCLVQMQHALKPGGQFYATFFEGPAMTRSTAPVVHGEITTYPHRDPFHYDANTIFWLCRNTALRPSRIGNWNHPRNQKMLAFIRDR